MNIKFDHQMINQLTVAISREMTPQAHARDSDTVFLGGPAPTEADELALANFAAAKDYQVIFASFDPADPEAGSVGFHAFVTDGVTKTAILDGGRLWKRSRSSASILLFSSADMVVDIDKRGKLRVRRMRDRYHDFGFDLARRAVAARGKTATGRVPIVSTIGNLITVLDTERLADTFDAA